MVINFEPKTKRYYSEKKSTITLTEEQNLAIAERLWCNSASIAITYAENREKAEAVIETIKKNRMHAIAIQANLSHTDEVTKLFDAAQ